MDIQFDITFIVEIVFALIGLLVMRYVYPWLKSNTSVKQQQELNGIFDVVVAAAQQLFGESGRGPERREYALKCLQAWLSTRGIKLDVDRLDAMLEAAVFRLKQNSESQNTNTSETHEIPEPVVDEIEELVEDDAAMEEEYTEVVMEPEESHEEDRQSSAE